MRAFAQAPAGEEGWNPGEDSHDWKMMTFDPMDRDDFFGAGPQILVQHEPFDDWGTQF